MRQTAIQESGYQAAFERLHGTDALADESAASRAKALARFLSRTFPAAGEEEWKYTDLGGVATRMSDGLHALAPSSREQPEAVSLSHDGSAAIQLRDGQVCSYATPAEGIVLDFGPSAIASELVQADNTVDAPTALADLNSALMTDALGIEIGAGAHAPIHIYHDNSAHNGPVQVRIAIRVDHGADATVIQHYRGAAESLTNAISRIDVGENSRLTLIRFQDEDPGALHLDATTIRLSKDATADVTAIDLGGDLARLDLAVELCAPGASANLATLMLAGKNRHCDHHLNVVHAAPGATSRVQCRAVAGGGGRTVMNGRILVQPDAQRTDAALENHNLVLHPQSEVDTKPELEIYADDVRCSHGATTGQIDSDALFYLRSRGIPELEARQMLVSAFVAAVTGPIDIEIVRKRADEVLSGMLSIEEDGVNDDGQRADQ